MSVFVILQVKKEVVDTFAHTTLSKWGEAKQNEIEIERMKKDADYGCGQAGKKMLFACPIKVAHSTEKKTATQKREKNRMKEKDAKKTRNGKQQQQRKNTEAKRNGTERNERKTENEENINI